MAMGVSFVDWFQNLNDLGVLDSITPFILIFTIIFAVLQKTQILGMGKKNYNTIVALSISLIVVIPHVVGNYPVGSDPIVIINSSLPTVSVVMIAILAGLLLIGVMGVEFVGGSSITGIIAILATGAIIFIFGNAAGFWSNLPPFLSFLHDEATRSMLIMILVFAIIVWFITRDESSSEGSMNVMSRGLGELGKAFQKGGGGGGHH